jgi:hypothetical protein
LKLVIELDCKGVKQNLRFLEITLNDGEPVTIPNEDVGKYTMMEADLSKPSSVLSDSLKKVKGK